VAFDFYFAGSQCEETTNLLKELNANVLKSYVNDMNEILKWFEYKKQGWTGKLLIDSGAFTAHRKETVLDIDKYIKWLNDNDNVIDYAIELDHIPGRWGQVKTFEHTEIGAKESWNNYLYMTEHCISPLKILPVFHQGENLKYLKRIVNYKINDTFVPYICISGNKELTSKQREDWYAQCYNIIKQSNNPNVKVHCLGSATLSNIVKFPLTSMDATSWIMTGATGSIFSDYGNIVVSKESKSSPEYIGNLPIEAQNVVSNYCNKYGITLEQVQDNYRYRMLINIHYMFDKSQTTSYVKRNLIRRTLF